MKKSHLLALTAALGISTVALAPAAFAEIGKYTVEAGYSSVDFDGTKLGALFIAGGYRFNKNFGLEGSIGFGLGEDSQQFSESGVTGTVKTKIESVTSVYAVGYLPVSKDLDLLARIGSSNMELKATATASGFGASATASETGSESAVSYGVGALYKFNDGKHGIRGDYTHTAFEDAGTNTLSISYVLSF